MKKIYRLGEDFFIAVAFISFLIGVVVKLMDVFGIGVGVNPENLLGFTMLCLLFSIALSLYELTQRK